MPTGGGPNFKHLCYLFSGFHLYILLAPAWLAAKLRSDLKHNPDLEGLWLTPLNTKQRIVGYLIPRYLLCLALLLLVYFSLYYWHRWLWGFPDEGPPDWGNEPYLKALGMFVPLTWHPLVTLSYFIISLWFNFALNIFSQSKFKNTAVAFFAGIILVLLIEFAALQLGGFWHGYGDSNPPFFNDFFEWPIILYIMLINYMLLIGTIFLVLKLLFAFIFNKSAVKTISKMETPIY